ncbi:MAG: hypothetical protein AAFO80_08300 [Pseudomonadota bacterium]
MRGQYEIDLLALAYDDAVIARHRLSPQSPSTDMAVVESKEARVILIAAQLAPSIVDWEMLPSDSVMRDALKTVCEYAFDTWEGDDEDDRPTRRDAMSAVGDILAERGHRFNPLKEVLDGINWGTGAIANELDDLKRVIDVWSL